MWWCRAGLQRLSCGFSQALTQPQSFHFSHLHSRLALQPDLLGWRPVFDSWLAALPEAITPEDREDLATLFGWLLPPCLRLASNVCPQVGRRQAACLPGCLFAHGDLKPMRRAPPAWGFRRAVHVALPAAPSALLLVEWSSCLAHASPSIHLGQVLPMHEINLAISCMRLVEAHLDDLVRQGQLHDLLGFVQMGGPQTSATDLVV